METWLGRPSPSDLQDHTNQAEQKRANIEHAAINVSASSCVSKRRLKKQVVYSTQRTLLYFIITKSPGNTKYRRYKKQGERVGFLSERSRCRRENDKKTMVAARDRLDYHDVLSLCFFDRDHHLRLTKNSGWIPPTAVVDAQVAAFASKHVCMAAEEKQKHINLNLEVKKKSRPTPTQKKLEQEEKRYFK